MQSPNVGRRLQAWCMFEEMLDVADELVGILEAREVADARLDQKRRLGNMICHSHFFGSTLVA